MSRPAASRSRLGELRTRWRAFARYGYAQVRWRPFQVVVASYLASLVVLTLAPQPRDMTWPLAVAINGLMLAAFALVLLALTPRPHDPLSAELEARVIHEHLRELEEEFDRELANAQAQAYALGLRDGRQRRRIDGFETGLDEAS